MNIRINYLTKHPNYTQKKPLTVKGLMLHSVGCAQPSAEAFVKNWNKASMSKGVHAMIDANTGDVWQLLPWSYKAWHCGSSANSTHIGVEMCESSYIKYTTGASFTIKDKAKAQAHAKATYNAAVELFAFLCRSYKLDPLKKGVIISHNEGRIMGVASGHVDPEHYWKGLGLAYTMDGFRKDVYNAMNPAQNSFPTIPTNNVPVVKLRITASVLNVRSGAGTLYKKVGTVAKGGVYTITETKNGWGRLKSGMGWISLKYTEKVK